MTTLKAIYKDTIKNVNTRALVFQMDQTIPTEEIKQCIKAALTYHTVKEFPDLRITATKNRVLD